MTDADRKKSLSYDPMYFVTDAEKNKKTEKKQEKDKKEEKHCGARGAAAATSGTSSPGSSFSCSSSRETRTTPVPLAVADIILIYWQIILIIFNLLAAISLI